MKTSRTLLALSFLMAFTINAKAQGLILDDFAPHRMPAPPYEAAFAKSKKTARSLKLTQLSVKQNDITDGLEWFRDNRLTIPRIKSPNNYFFSDEVTPYELSDDIPLQSGGIRLTSGIASPQANFYFYGPDNFTTRYLLITGPNNAGINYFLDFGTYMGDSESGNYTNMSLTWAAIEDNVLYVSNSHNTYASTTHGINAFITAIDLETLEVIWRSEPLVANSRNFEIIDDVIVSGYGFTREPDYLYVLDKFSGRKTATLKLATGPEYIIRKEERLYVRTYNRDYIFKIER